jgi:hypothetical protein
MAALILSVFIGIVTSKYEKQPRIKQPGAFIGYNNGNYFAVIKSNHEPIVSYCSNNIQTSL